MDYVEWIVREVIFPRQIFTTETLVVLAWVLVGELLMMFAMNCIVQVRIFAKRRVFNVPIPKNQFRREVFHSWHIFLDAVVLYLLLYFRILRPSAFSWSGTLLTFFLFVIWLEIYFYAVHWAMHAFKTLRPIHREHHASRVNTAFSGFASSFSEKMILLSFALLFITTASWFMNVTMTGIALIYAFYYLIVVGGHCNTEFPVVSRTMMRLGLATPTNHALHHARFTVNYGFAFVFLDRWFDTYSSETDELRERALAGRGYTTLKRPPRGNHHAI